MYQSYLVGFVHCKLRRVFLQVVQVLVQKYDTIGLFLGQFGEARLAHIEEDLYKIGGSCSRRVERAQKAL